jgi:hypothetical protein
MSTALALDCRLLLVSTHRFLTNEVASDIMLVLEGLCSAYFIGKITYPQNPLLHMHLSLDMDYVGFIYGLRSTV